ncbi:MAG: FkbM family methyltransferase [Gemmatimonadales bacterium]
MGVIAKARRMWRYGAQPRARFGIVEGTRLASSLADAEYRRPAGELVPMHIPGWSVPVALRARSSDVEVFRQVILGRDLDFDLDNVPTRIIDGGANIGLASLIFARQWPNAQIVAIELEPANFALAQRNCAHLPNITLRNAAIWGSSGSVAVVNPDADAHSFRAEMSTEAGEIRAFRIGELLDTLEWESVDLVKLDIEGAERVVLGDADAWLPRVRHLLVELHDRFEPGCTDAFEAAVNRDEWQVLQQGEYLLASRRRG